MIFLFLIITIFLDQVYNKDLGTWYVSLRGMSNIMAIVNVWHSYFNGYSKYYVE